MLNLDSSHINMSFGLSLRSETDGELIAVLFWREEIGDHFLLLYMSHADIGTLVVFWQAVLAAELSSAVWTLEWHEGFLAALLTVHAGASLFHA